MQSVALSPQGCKTAIPALRLNLPRAIRKSGAEDSTPREGWQKLAGGRASETRRRSIVRKHPGRGASRLQFISGGWMEARFPSDHDGHGQSRPSTLTVSPTAHGAVGQYIANQAEHHRVKPFREELIEMLHRAQN